jgi:tetratricopeptide (TPR) repeat protein
VVYLRQWFLPVGLAAPYPNPAGGQGAPKICLALLVLAAVSALVWAVRKSRLWLLVGWLWYLGMLFPVIGIIQISADAAHADRYTYLPEIGLAVAGTWAVAEWSAAWKHRRLVLGSLTAVVIAALMVCARQQTTCWRNGEALWKRSLACFPGSALANYNLANTLAQSGKPEEAIAHYRNALQSDPAHFDAHMNLGLALAKTGQVEEAIAQFRHSLQIQPGYAKAHLNLGDALLRQGRTDEAVASLQQALALQPNYAKAHYDLANVWFDQGRMDDAVAHYRMAIAADPEFVDAHFNLGNALLNTGHPTEAIAEYRQTLALNPNYGAALNNLAWALATSPQAGLRDGAAALALAIKGEQLTGGKNPLLLRTLAAAYAETGKYGMAAATAQRALELATEQKNDALTAALQSEAKLYQSGAPLRNAPP